MPVRVSRALLVLAVGLTVGLVAVVVLSRPTAGETAAPRAGSSPAGASPTPGGGARAVTVLHDWDVRRAAAWASGDADALASLYTAGSTAGAADVALLRRYRSRGLVVRDLRMQVLRARVLTSRPRLVELEVTERLASAVAHEVRAGSRPLPRDVATTHRLVLRRVGGTWLMVRVSVVPSQR
jgi:hypothetical protein